MISNKMPSPIQGSYKSKGTPPWTPNSYSHPTASTQTSQVGLNIEARKIFHPNPIHVYSNNSFISLFEIYTIHSTCYTFVLDNLVLKNIISYAVLLGWLWWKVLVHKYEGLQIYFFLNDFLGKCGTILVKYVFNMKLNILLL